MDDNLYQNNGESFYPGNATKQSRQSALDDQISDSLNLLEEIESFLQERIKHYSSVQSIPEDARRNPEEFMHHYEAAKIVCDNLEHERGAIAALIARAER